MSNFNLELRVELVARIDAGMTTTLYEKVLKLPASKVSITAKERKQLKQWVPMMDSVLKESGLVR